MGGDVRAVAVEQEAGKRGRKHSPESGDTTVRRRRGDEDRVESQKPPTQDHQAAVGVVVAQRKRLGRHLFSGRISLKFGGTFNINMYSSGDSVGGSKGPH